MDAYLLRARCVGEERSGTLIRFFRLWKDSRVPTQSKTSLYVDSTSTPQAATAEKPKSCNTVWRPYRFYKV